MHYYEVAPTQIIRRGSDTFTYASKQQLAIGQIVRIEIGKKLTRGVVIQAASKPDYPTKEISVVIEDTPLPEELVQTALWLASYYATPLATVWQTVLPRGLEKNRRPTSDKPHASSRKRTKIVFTQDQAAAVENISTMSPGSALLHGVTGSGKTAVYIELARQTLRRGQSVIVLVPEIALTSQLVDEFSHHFSDCTVVHSKQTEAERHMSWKNTLLGSQPQVIIGPRSALFMPLKKLGLIVVDECHEPSYKQEQSPRYNALRLASILGAHHKAKIIFGSATPLVTDYYLAQHAKRPIISMPTPAVTDTVKPRLTMIDMTKRTHFKRHRFFSDALLAEIESTLANHKQVLLFHNRRGSAATTLCENCGWQAGCTRCFVPLVLHADSHTLRCHVCGNTAKVPTSCPECHHADIIHKGIGTKRIEAEIKKLFPAAAVARFDGDSANDDTLEKNYAKLYDGSLEIIIGTQAVAKGLDLPHLRTVGIVQADAGLSLPDNSAPERTFQLLAQTVGRVGRSHHATSVIVQSYQPTHPAVVDGIGQNYDDFYTRTLALRHHTNFPPFCYLLKLVCTYKTEAAVIKNAKQLQETLRHNLPPTAEILGPTPAFYERVRDTYRWQLVLKSSKRSDLLHALTLLPPTHWQYELDPLSLL